MRLAIETDPHSLDPAQVFSSEEAMIALLVFNTLLEPGTNAGFIPVLIESLPATSFDGLTHTFRLKKGVRFSNGHELTADDVVFSFERMFDPRTGTASGCYFGSIAGHREFEEARKREAAAPDEVARHRGRRWIEPVSVSGLRVRDRYTVEIRLSQPDLAFLKVLTTPPGGIVCRAAVEDTGKGFASQPVGTGPFMLKQWIRGARLRLVRNPHYFRADRSRPGDVDVFVNADWTTWGMMFERAELDVQHYIADTDSLRFKRDPILRKRLRVVNGSSPTFVFLNCELPPFTNRLVRVALNHAIDREAIVQAMLRRAVPARGPLPLTVRGFNEGLRTYEYDPQKAKALLAQAGFPNGFNTTLWTARDHATWVKLALLMQASLRKIGVNAELKEVSFPAFLESSGQRRKVPMGIWDWVSAFDDPKDTLDSLLNGDNITEENCLNNAFYSNPRVQQLFRESVAELDPKRRLEIYRQIEREVVEDAPWIFLIQMNTEMLVQPWVKGFTPSGFWPPARVDTTWIER